MKHLNSRDRLVSVRPVLRFVWVDFHIQRGNRFCSPRNFREFDQKWTLLKAVMRTHLSVLGAFRCKYVVLGFNGLHGHVTSAWKNCFGLGYKRQAGARANPNNSTWIWWGTFITGQIKAGGKWSLSRQFASPKTLVSIYLANVSVTLHQTR